MKGFTVITPDLLGTGETGPGEFKGDSYIDGHSLNVWFSSILIGRSIVGVRAGDVVRLSHFMKKLPLINEVYGLARQEMSSVLLHAAAFDPSISRIALVNPYSSYRSIVMNRFYNPGFIQSTVAGAIKLYDLPDLAASLAPRKMVMIGTTDCLGKAADPGNLEEDMSVIWNAYHLKHADDNLRIIPEITGEKPGYYFENWIMQ